MRRCISALLLLGSCSRSPAPPTPPAPESAPPAPAPALPAHELPPPPPEALVQKALRAEPMFFHPELPLVGQEAGALCDVWDLPLRLYRGAVPAAECRGWARPRPPIAPEIAAATPEEVIDESTRRDHPGAGTLVWATSHDGRWVATARRGGIQAHVWDAGTRRLLRAVGDKRLGGATPIADLMWTRTGRLVIAAVKGDVDVWNALDPDPSNDTPVDARHPRERSDGFSIDPAGRYLGFKGSAYGIRYDMVGAGVLGFGEERAKELLHADFWLGNRRTERVAWASARPTAFVVERRTSSDAELCGFEREVLTVISVDPSRGIHDMQLGLPRALLAIAPSPDGRLALVETGDGPPVEPCEAERVPSTSDDHGVVLRLWEPETGRRRDLFHAPVAGVAWAPAGARFAVASGGRVHVFEGNEARPVTSWEGGAPLGFSADGGSVSYAGPAGPAVRAIASGLVTPSAAAAAPDPQRDAGARVEPGFLADPSGRWAVGPPVSVLYDDYYPLRRISDGVTLFLPEARRAHAFASDGAFVVAPPEGLAFRLGADVLRGPIVRAAEATFAVPEPELGERFARGERLSSAPTR